MVADKRETQRKGVFNNKLTLAVFFLILMSMKNTQPHEVDIYVGQRIRKLRLLRKYSQDYLAKKAGVTFQQMQKYENGANRVSASKLYEVSNALGVPVSFFFDGLPSKDDEPPYNAAAQLNALTDDALKLMSLMNDIDNQNVKTKLMNLIKEIGSSGY